MNRTAPRSSCSRVENGATLTVEDGVTLDFTQGGLYVEAGATLVVEPGATLRFGQYDGLTVKGTLSANGAAFTALAPSTGWNGIDFLAGSLGPLNGSSLVEGVGAGPASVYVAGGILYMQGLTIQGMAGGAPRGLYVTSGSVNGVSHGGIAQGFSDVEIRFHDSDGAYAYNDGILYLSGGTLRDNGAPGGLVR